MWFSTRQSTRLSTRLFAAVPPTSNSDCTYRSYPTTHTSFVFVLRSVRLPITPHGQTIYPCLAQDDQLLKQTYYISPKEATYELMIYLSLFIAVFKTARLPLHAFFFFFFFAADSFISLNRPAGHFLCCFRSFLLWRFLTFSHLTRNRLRFIRAGIKYSVFLRFRTVLQKKKFR